MRIIEPTCISSPVILNKVHYQKYRKCRQKRNVLEIALIAANFSTIFKFSTFFKCFKPHTKKYAFSTTTINCLFFLLRRI